NTVFPMFCSVVCRRSCCFLLLGSDWPIQGKWSYHDPQGAPCSRNLSRIPQWMNHSSGKSNPVCTVKKENGTQSEFSRYLVGVE
uniref:Uncharacterized protein n=1 Tax=Coturnix japonica TaxID=93934 RepID=A0A8C2Y7V3_COTJA